MVGVAGTIGFGVWLAESRIQIGYLDMRVATLTKRIEDPKTGYVVKLAQAETNSVTCAATIADQNESTQKFSQQSEAALQEAAANYAAEHAQRVAAERQIGTIMSATPAGNTVCQRVESVDTQIMKDLGK